MTERRGQCHNLRIDSRLLGLLERLCHANKLEVIKSSLWQLIVKFLHQLPWAVLRESVTEKSSEVN
jgi:hypothetical protein